MENEIVCNYGGFAPWGVTAFQPNIKTKKLLQRISRHTKADLCVF